MLLQSYGGLPLLHCPMCGQFYNHVQGVFTRLGSDPLEACDYPGTERGAGTADSRRSALWERT